jgi:hypothetical protein
VSPGLCPLSPSVALCFLLPNKCKHSLGSLLISSCVNSPRVTLSLLFPVSQ